MHAKPAGEFMWIGHVGQHSVLSENARGVALVESVLVIGTLLLFMSGIIDYWTLLRESDIIVTATRHGARSGAATGQLVASTVSLSRACSNLPPGNPVLISATQLTFKYLVAEGLESGTCTFSVLPTPTCTGTDFTVFSQLETDCEGGFAQRAVRVTIASNGDPRCLMCTIPGLRNINLRGSSVFALEADCASLGTLTCT